MALARLDRSSALPLYRQVETILRAELANADEGTQAGLTELGLTARFGVSRYTIRQALDLLRREGLVDRQKKRGTFLAKPVIQQPLEGIYSFGRSMSGLGLAPESRVLSLRSVRPDESLAGQLELASDSVRLVELVRLRSAGGEPLVVETIWLPEATVPGVWHVDLTGSVYDVLRDLYRLEVSSAQESIRPVVLDLRRSRLLEVSRGSPAFFVERVSYADERPVEVRQSVIRGDRYLYSVLLRVEQTSVVSA